MIVGERALLSRLAGNQRVLWALICYWGLLWSFPAAGPNMGWMYHKNMKVACTGWLQDIFCIVNLPRVNLIY
jgi:hypothetical protein